MDRTEALPVRAQIVAAVRANLAPGLLLQAAAVLLVVAYYYWPAAHASFEDVARFKVAVGYPYSFVSLAFFAGILPLLLRRFQPGTVAESTRAWVFYAIFWGFLGVIIDAFYRFQAWAFGSATDVPTISLKVAVDMLLFSPLFALPLVCVSFLWKDTGFRVSRTRSALGRSWYAVRVWPMVLAAWIVWIPAVAVIYSLPLALQVPVQNIIECLWVLILLFLTQPRADAGDAEPDHASS